jgi:hypothetical protein
MKHLTLTLLLLVLAGCVTMTYEDTEGNIIRYERFLEQEINEVLLTLPNGAEFLLEGQKSKLPHVTITSTGIEIGGKGAPAR